ncbi:MAG: HAD-IA family hydrolase [Betaproteobacteria bacterium]|nr:HAD-IA family hydrolase [Betaproteobacteria bacterium]
MPQRFELLVFDWDGTLMDSAASIVASLQWAADDLGLPVPSEAQARHIIGLGLQEAIAEIMPALPLADYPRLIDRYRFHYLARDHEIALFDGVAEGIPALAAAGFTLAVATGKSRRGLDRALEHSGLRSCFQATRCADESVSKPHPAMLEALMNELGVGSAATVMIGDTTHDLAMARSAGVRSIAVAYGAHEKDALAPFEPLLCAEHFREVAQWLHTNG